MPPRVDAAGFGRSAPTKARKVGLAFEPDEGPAKTIFFAWEIGEAVTVPDVVTALLGVELSRIPSPVNVTETTLPPPARGDPLTYKAVALTVPLTSNL